MKKILNFPLNVYRAVSEWVDPLDEYFRPKNYQFFRALLCIILIIPNLLLCVLGVIYIKLIGQNISEVNEEYFESEGDVPI